MKYLESDARKSLKKLAEDLGKKTSTIYHRLQKMQNNKTILGYSVVFNPKIFQISKIGMVTITLKPHNLKGFDNVFIQSFATFLKEQYSEIIFISIIESDEHTKEVLCIIPFKNQDDFEKFSKEIKENLFVGDITYKEVSEIVKGQKLFNYDKNIFKKVKQAEVTEEFEEFNQIPTDPNDIYEEKEIQIDMSGVMEHNLPNKFNKQQRI